MKNANEMLEHVAEFAKKLFMDNGEVHPMWILESEKQIVPIMSPFDGETSKDQAIAFVRAKAKEIKAEAVGFMAEAWMVPLKKTEKLDKSPSEHEDRREIIQVYAEDRSGTMVMGNYYILRPEHGRATLSPFKPMDGNAEGRFSSVLEKA